MHICCTHVFIYTVLLPELQMGEAWEPLNKAMLCRKSGNTGQRAARILSVLTRYHSLRVKQLGRESGTLCTRELPVWDAMWAKLLASDSRAELIGLSGWTAQADNVTAVGVT
jgi:hypothetical protein